MSGEHSPFSPEQVQNGYLNGNGYVENGVARVDGNFFVNTNIRMQESSYDEVPILLAVANRLPVTMVTEEVAIDLNGEIRKKIVGKPSYGGLATGLNSALHEGNKRNAWIGWDGLVENADTQSPEEIFQEREGLEEALRTLNANGVYDLGVVRLTKEEEDYYYSGYANGVLWEIFHDMPDEGSYHFADAASYQKEWETYQQVNKKFAAAAVEASTVKDNLWVQDYHLLLMGKNVREFSEERQHQNINFFLHIPFPSAHSFGLLPEEQRVQILEGLLNYNTAGFQTQPDVERFIEAVQAHLPDAAFEDTADGRVVISYGERKTLAAAFPISIDAEAFKQLSEQEESLAEAIKFEQEVDGRQIVFDICRLDPSKGIPERLQAYDQTVSDYPDVRGKIAMIQVVAPGRLNVPAYKRLFDQIHDLTNEINTKHEKQFGIKNSVLLNDQGIRNANKLAGLYRAGRVGMITPKRDGMNLVVKEVVACSSPDLALIVGKDAGAAREFDGENDAFIVDATDIGLMAQVLHTAINLPEEVRRAKNRRMKEIVHGYTVFDWVKIQRQVGNM